MANSASPQLMALLGLLAVAGYQNRDKLQGLFSNLTGGGSRTGTGSPMTDTMARDHRIGTQSGNVASGAAGGGLGGLLGGLFGGASGGGLGGALSDLMKQFNANGHGETAQSWVSTGPNRDVGSNELEEALGPDALRELSQKTGLPREEILDRLRQVLPTTIDKLTPQGRLPTRDEEMMWARAANAA